MSEGGQSGLSRRERQIMDVLHAGGALDAQSIQRGLPDAPGDMGVRKLLSILEKKGHVRRRKEGRKFIYRPRQDTRRAGASALEHLLATFFGGSVEEALAVHLASAKTQLNDEQLASLVEMIEAKRAEAQTGRSGRTDEQS